MERRIDEINRFTVGWTAYFRLADTPTPFEDLDDNVEAAFSDGIALDEDAGSR
jgi:Group II intron, maturase-specific domain